MKRYVLSFTTIILIGVLAFTFLGNVNNTLAANIEVSNEKKVKVFVGSFEGLSEADMTTRQAEIESLSKVRNATSAFAVINLNDYYTLEQVVTLVNETGLSVTTLHIWEPATTGRMWIGVENNDFEAAYAAMEKYAYEVLSDENSDEISKEVHQKFLSGEFNPFALTVEGPVQSLSSMSANIVKEKNVSLQKSREKGNDASDMIATIDVAYYPSVEQYAKSSGRIISYIALATKPDGAE